MTQPMTLPKPGPTQEISDAIALVDVARVDPTRMEARHRITGALLGTARHSSHPQCEWIGWLIEVDHYAPEVIRSTGAAEIVLLWLAGCFASRGGGL